MDPKELYERYRECLVECLSALDREVFAEVVWHIEEAYRNGKTIFICGNGGSAATASHFAVDLSKGPLGHTGNRPVKPFRVIALTDSVPTITAWANDTGFDRVFADPLWALGQEGDVLIVISASGNSPNVLKAVVVAGALEMTTIGFCGFDGGELAEMVDVALIVETEKGEYGVVEDMHDILHHVITAYFIKKLSPLWKGSD